MHPQRQRRCHNRYGADSGDVARSFRSKSANANRLRRPRPDRFGRFVPRTVASAGIPQGVWLIDNEAAVQIFDCRNLLCGRILWLSIPRDPQSRLDRDKKNPEPALRQRPLCGLTILWGLRPTGPDRWTDGWFYNPDDGDTYNISAELRSADTIDARIYLGDPLLGKTKTLHRVPHGTSNGWC